MTNNSQSSSQKLHKYRKLGCIWERAHSGSTGVKVNAILLIIGSSSWLLTMTKTSRGGFYSTYLWSWTATNKSGAFLQRNGALGGLEESWKTWKKLFGSVPWDFTEEKAVIQDLCSFVSALKCSSLIELVLYQGFGALVIICGLIQGEYGINNMVG